MFQRSRSPTNLAICRIISVGRHGFLLEGSLLSSPGIVVGTFTFLRQPTSLRKDLSRRIILSIAYIEAEIIC